MHRNRDPDSSREFIGVPVEGRQQTVVVEHRRTQLGLDAPDVPRGGFEQRGAVVQA